MPRQLGDVLHYFGPELEGEASRAPPTREATALAVPLADGDLVRAALVWNLAVELARQGDRCAVLAPVSNGAGALWPRPGRGALGVEVRHAKDADFVEALARLRGAGAGSAAFVLVPLTPASLAALPDRPCLRGALVLARPEEGELANATSALERVAHSQPGAVLGASIFGVRSRTEAERTFDRLAETTERRLGRTLLSYGLLVDDLQLCRSIVTRHPVALSHPHGPAARALADVVRLLRQDAEDGALA